MAISVGDIQAVFRVVDEASVPLRNIEKEVAQTSSTLGTMGKALGVVTIAATATVAGISAIGGAIVKLGQEGSAVGDISEQFDKLAQKAGIEARDALEALRRATDGTLSDFDLMKSSLSLLSSGFKGSAKDLETMASAARVLAERGMSMEEALSMVNSAMTTGRTRALAMQGVVIDTAQSMKDLTEATTEEGGAVQESAKLHLKQQEILKGLARLTEENGRVQMDFGDRIDQVRVKFSNLYNAFAKQVSESPALNAAIERIGAALLTAFGDNQEEAIANLVKKVEQIGTAIADMAVSAIAWFGRIRPTLEQVANTLWSVLVPAWTGLVTAISTVGDWIGKAIDWFKALPQPVQDAAKAITIFTGSVMLLGEALKILGASSLIGGIGSATGALVKLGAELASIVRLAGVIGTGSAISLVFTNIAASATAALGPLGALAIAIGSATAVLMAGYQAWKWWNESAERAGDSAASVEAAWRQMDEASALVGYRVTSQTDALIILREEAERQRNSVTASTKATLDDAAAQAKREAAIKLTAEQLKKLREQEAEMSGAKMRADLEEMIATYERLEKKGIKPTIEAQAKLHESVEAVIKINEEAGIKIPSNWLHIRTETESMVDVYDRVEKAMIKMTKASGANLDALLSSGQKFVEGQQEIYGKLIVGIAQLPAGIRRVENEFGDLVAPGGQLTVTVDGVTKIFKKGGEEASKAWGEGFKDIAKNFGNLMADAIINGNWKNAFSAVGSQIGSFLGEKLGGMLSGTLGKVLGSILPGLGSLLGPLVGWIGDKLFKTEGKRVNDLRDAFIAAAGGLAALDKKAHDAGLTLNRLLRASTVKEYEAAIAELNKELEATAKLQGELADAQAELAGRSVMDWQKAEDLIKKYGGTLDTLGQQFVAAKQAASWKEVWDDWQTLIDMGADVGGVLVSMKDEIQNLVNESVRIGTEIPAQFKPLIEELIRTGQLFDANGEAITDLSQLKFGAPLVSELDKLILKIDDLIKALTERLVPAFQNVGNTNIRDVEIGYRFVARNAPPEDLGGDFEGPAMATGGIVRTPTYALIGEAGPEAIVPLGRGGFAPQQPVVITVISQLDGREVARNQIRYLPAQLSLSGL